MSDVATLMHANEEGSGGEINKRRMPASTAAGVIGTILTATALTITLIVTLRNKFEAASMDMGWSTFALHPILMTLAFGFLAPVAVASYRGIEDMLGVSHETAKAIHAGLMSAALLCGLLGFADMWIVHAHPFAPPVYHFQTVHSWLGFAALLAFILQWLSGLAAFYGPKSLVPPTARGAWLPVHVFIGLFAVFGSLFSICTGILALDNRGGTEQTTALRVSALLAAALAGFIALALRGKPHGKK